MKKLGIREGGVSRFSVEIFLSDSVNNFLGRTLLCFRNFWLSNKFCLRGLCLQFRSIFFFVGWYRKTSTVNPSVLCLKKFLVTKSLLDKSGVSRFSVAIFLSHSWEKFHRVILQCLQKILISKTLWIWGRGGGRTSRFPSRTFCFTVPTKLVEHLFSVSLVSSMTIVYA